MRMCECEVRGAHGPIQVVWPFRTPVLELFRTFSILELSRLLCIYCGSTTVALATVYIRVYSKKEEILSVSKGKEDIFFEFPREIQL